MKMRNGGTYGGTGVWCRKGLRDGEMEGWIEDGRIGGTN